MASETDILSRFTLPLAPWKKYALTALVSAALGSGLTLATVTRTEERIVDMHATQGTEAKVEAKAFVKRDVRREGKIVKSTRKVTKPSGETVESTRESVTLPSRERTETRAEVQAEAAQKSETSVRAEVKTTTGSVSRYSLRLAVDPTDPRNWQRADAEVGARLGGLPLWLILSGSAAGGVRVGGRLEF